MDDSSSQARDIILVLCHSFFHNAFRLERPVNLTTYKLWAASRFIANFIIEKQAELPEGSSVAITSKLVFDSFASKFLGEEPSNKLIETVEILRNSIVIINSSSVNNLSLDDGILVISDTLYSRSNYEPILVSNIPKKVEKAEEFYHKKDPNAKIPYQIYNVIQTEAYLRGKFPELCKLIDERIKLGS